MNDEKRSDHLDPESQDELDAFARALLNRKTEMRIFRDEDSDEVEIGFSDDDREEAERTMSQALDTLRKSRGQKTIEEEESAYWYMEEKTGQPAAGTPEQTGEEAGHKSHRQPRPVRRKKKSQSARKKAEKKPDTSSSRTAEPEKKKKKKPAEATRKATPAAEKTAAEKKPSSRHSSRRKIVGWIVAFCVLAAAALGLYCWKVLVWNPQNNVTEEQKSSYMKLVDYADEYGSGLMSDAEKAEILDLKADYDSLTAKQKTELDTYFREQTKSDQYPEGRTFQEIWQEESDKKQAADDSSQPEYQALVAYLTNWNDKTDEEKQQITTYKDTWNSLSQTLKTQVDDQLKAVTGQTFSQLVSEQEETIRSQQVENQAQVDAQKAELQAQIDALNAELQPYAEYGQSLQQELNQARIEGMDTSEIEAQIAANDEYVQSLQSQISSLEYQRDVLQ